MKKMTLFKTLTIATALSNKTIGKSSCLSYYTTWCLKKVGVEYRQCLCQIITDFQNFLLLERG